MRTLRASVLAATAVLLSACAVRGPVIDTGPKPPAPGGTIAGTVRAVGNEPLSGRRVTATDVSSGASYGTTTTATGGYTLEVPRGTYRLEVELRPGETLAEQPAETEVNASDLDPDRDFLVTVRPPAGA